MAKSVDIYARFHDKATAGVRALSDRLAQLGPAGRGAAALVSRGLQMMRQHAALTARAIEGIGHAARRAGQWVGQAMASASQRLRSMAKYAALAGVAFAGWQIKAGLGGKAELQDFQSTLEIVTKSAARAKKIIADALAFSERTPFEPRPVIEAATQLTVYGLSYEKWLRRSGELAAAFKVDIGDVVGALGRLKAGQSGEAFERLRRMGITSTALQEKGILFGKGGELKSDIETTMTAVAQIIDEKFGGTLEKQSRNFSGLWSTIVGKWDLLRMKMATPLFERLSADMAKLIGLWEKWDESAVAGPIGRALARAYDVVKSYGSKYITALREGGLKGLWAALKPDLEAGVSAVFGALGSLAAKAFLAPFKLVLKGEFGAAGGAAAGLMLVPGVAQAAGAVGGGAMALGAKGMATGAGGTALATATGLLPYLVPIVVIAVSAYLLREWSERRAAEAKQAEYRAVTKADYSGALWGHAEAGQLSNISAAMKEFGRMAGDGATAAAAYTAVMAKYGLRQKDLTARLTEQIPVLQEIVELERNRIAVMDEMWEKGSAEIAAAQGRTESAVEEFRAKGRSPEEQQAVLLDRMKLLRTDLAAIDLRGVRAEEDMTAKLRTRLGLVERLRDTAIEQLSVAEKIRAEHQRTAEALMGMTNMQRLRAAGLREFLKTATVEQFARLGPEAMGLINKVPELQKLAEQRGLVGGLARKFGFAAPGPGQAAGADAVLAEITKDLAETQRMLAQATLEEKGRRQGEFKQAMINLNIPDIKIIAKLEHDGKALVETLRALVLNAQGEIAIALEKGINQRLEQDRAKANEAAAAQ